MANQSPKHPQQPAFFHIRSHTLFIVTTVGIGMFTDLFLYGLIVPILPFILKDRVHLAESQLQSHVSSLLAAYAASSFVFSPVAGAIADKTRSRQMPFLVGLVALMLATVLLFTGSSVAVLTIARIAQGASSAVCWTVGLALLISQVGPENLGKTIGSIFSIVSVGELFAPVLGGVLYEKAGYLAVAGISIGMIVVDFIMRLFAIEKKVAEQYMEPKCQQTHFDESPEANHPSTDNTTEDPESVTPTESSPLLTPKSLPTTSDPYYIEQHNRSAIFHNAPILHCLRSRSLILALIVALVQAIILAAYDATIPTHAYALYRYTSLKSSLLFIPLGVLNVLFGPIGGWAVDKYGRKPVAVLGYAYLVPALALLRLPGPEPRTQQAVLLAVLLGLCGIGMAVIGAPSIVEAGAEVDRFHKRNPQIFGEQGPYAQLYGLHSMFFCSGLAVGPLVAGHLREAIGYGDMNAVLAGVSGVTAVACWVWLGGKPESLKRLMKRSDPR